MTKKHSIAIALAMHKNMPDLKDKKRFTQWSRDCGAMWGVFVRQNKTLQNADQKLIDESRGKFVNLCFTGDEDDDS